MKLKDKNTGEIGRLKESNCDEYEYLVVIDGNPQVYRYYHTLKEVTDSYEDYEEPKEYWFIAEMCAGLQKKQDTDNGEDRFNKKIGNYFETEEEAERAVEKLKAWKRLESKGFKFDGYDVANNGDGNICGQAFYKAGDYLIEDIKKDLDLLFGGEK